MNITRSTAKELRKLQELYVANIVQYPRIDNNFIRLDDRYEMYPHPTFPYNPINGMDTIDEERVMLNKKSALLFLSILRITSPANLQNHANVIEDFFDDDLNYKNKNKQDEANALIENLFNFMDNEHINIKEILKMYRNIFRESSNRRYFNYKIISLPFFIENEKKREKIVFSYSSSQKKETDKDKATDDEDSIYEENVKNKKSIEEAINEYDRIKKREYEEAKKVLARLNNIEQNMKTFQDKSSRREANNG